MSVTQVICLKIAKISHKEPFEFEGHINGLLTGCEGHTEKYRTAVFVQRQLATGQNNNIKPKHMKFMNRYFLQ